MFVRRWIVSVDHLWTMYVNWWNWCFPVIQKDVLYNFASWSYCRMNVCSVFSRIMLTCAKNSQSLKCLPSHHFWFYNLHAKSLYAVERNSMTLSSGSYSVRALVNHVRHMQRYYSDKADDKTASSTESPPGLLRRFHQTYKEHGKILVCVHLITSAVWASAFYCAAVRYYMLWTLFICK